MAYGFNQVTKLGAVGVIAVASMGLGGCNGNSKVDVGQMPAVRTPTSGVFGAANEILTTNPTSVTNKSGNGVLVVNDSGQALIVVPNAKGDVFYSAEVNPDTLKQALAKTADRGIFGYNMQFPVPNAVVTNDPSVFHGFAIVIDTDLSNLTALQPKEVAAFKSGNITAFTVTSKTVQTMGNSVNGQKGYTIFITNPTPVAGDKIKSVHDRVFPTKSDGAKATPVSFNPYLIAAQRVRLA